MVQLSWRCLCAILVESLASSAFLYEYWKNVAFSILIYELWYYDVVTCIYDYWEGLYDLYVCVMSKHMFLKLMIGSTVHYSDVFMCFLMLKYESFFLSIWTLWWVMLMNLLGIIPQKWQRSIYSQTWLSWVLRSKIGQ